MKYVYLDASEVVKTTMDRPISQNARLLIVSSLSSIETIFILNRHRNEVGIPAQAFRSALRSVIEEFPLLGEPPK